MISSHLNFLCRDARGRGRDHGAWRRNPFLFASLRAADEGSLSNFSCEKNPRREIFHLQKTSILLDFLLSCASLRTIPISLKISKYVILIIKYYD